MATITKKELLDRIADRLGFSRVQVKRVVQAFLDEMVTELVKDNRLEFRDFGVFECRRRPARLAQNPKTLDRISVPSKRRVRFKPGRLLKAGLGVAATEKAAAARRQTTAAAAPPAPAGIHSTPSAATVGSGVSPTKTGSSVA